MRRPRSRLAPTFHESSVALSALALVAATALYVSTTPRPTTGDVGARHIAPFVVACVVLAAIQAITHSVLAITRRRSATADERDRAISNAGERIGGYALAVVVFTALCTAAATDGNQWTAYVLLGGWTAAQLLEYSVELVLYRRSR